MKSAARCAVVLVAVLRLWAADSATPAALSDQEKEQFLASARIVSVAAIGHGVTKPLRAKLQKDQVVHDAEIQRIDNELPDFFATDGSRVSMRDSWRFNVAAYKIDRLLGLNMVPVTVSRPYLGKPAAFTWWVDHVAMEEAERRKKEVAPPDKDTFERQVELGHVFDELIINIDRNLSNLLITDDWKLVLIDHTRTFTAYSGIRNPDNLHRCSRRLLAAMKGLTAESVSKAVGPNLTRAEVQALMSRRDKIVAFFAKRAAEKGEAAVLFP